MRMVLIVLVLIYGMELDHASWWYFAAFAAAAWDGYFKLTHRQINRGEHG